MSTYSIVINFRGGIVSPGFFKEILILAKDARVEHIRFGLRQQLLLDIPKKYFTGFAKGCERSGIQFFLKKDALPNLVSSYPAEGIFTHDSWLKEGVYKDVFDLFDYEPQLKINICDKNQRFVLFFTGHLNWISSPSTHFWYLYIRFPHSRDTYLWPELVYTNDISILSKELERLLLNSKLSNKIINNPLGISLYNTIKEDADFHYTNKPIEVPFVIPAFSLPYYEGFNKLNNSYWLGIYRRNENFPIQFLLEVCHVCLESKIGELYTTSWKSVIIKGIEPSDRRLWDYVLGKYRINVRHAANELNWQIEDDREALILKRMIIRYFDKEDVRTYGLCFAIQTKPLFNMYASVVIRKSVSRNLNQLQSQVRYDILYESFFNANGNNLIMFRENVEKNHIAPYLVSLCKMYYEQESYHDVLLENKNVNSSIEKEIVNEQFVYQCEICLSVYDEQVGDVEIGIAAGTMFSDLPENFYCSVCEAGKNSFVQKKVRALVYSK